MWLLVHHLPAAHSATRIRPWSALCRSGFASASKRYGQAGDPVIDKLIARRKKPARLKRLYRPGAYRASRLIPRRLSKRVEMASESPASTRM
ncbi:hypothetical protein [Aureimonas sp. D3]|uniref:hypothetical protein n=1 Tax=Aureimonas sp. D3 TaxID=1638164 RepID=UPI00078026BA|nr:hypothetical protein [Aureimonas sp. D3]